MIIFQVIHAYVAILVEVKVKVNLEGEKRYSSTLSLTSALDGGGWSMVTGKDPIPIHRRLVGPQGRSGRMRKISLYRDSIPGPYSP
jgi:hypothetical protein